MRPSAAGTRRSRRSLRATWTSSWPTPGRWTPAERRHRRSPDSDDQISREVRVSGKGRILASVRPRMQAAGLKRPGFPEDRGEGKGGEGRGGGRRGGRAGEGREEEVQMQMQMQMQTCFKTRMSAVTPPRGTSWSWARRAAAERSAKP